MSSESEAEYNDCLTAMESEANIIANALTVAEAMRDKAFKREDKQQIEDDIDELTFKAFKIALSHVDYIYTSLP